MGKGTLFFDRMPLKKRIYGDELFHIRPCYQGKHEITGREIYFIACRPDEDGVNILLEGEFGCGPGSLVFEKKEALRGCYTNTRYVYYKEDVQDMTPIQKKKIMRWAVDGQL